MASRNHNAVHDNRNSSRNRSRNCGVVTSDAEARSAKKHCRCGASGSSGAPCQCDASTTIDSSTNSGESSFTRRGSEVLRSLWSCYTVSSDVLHQVWKETRVMLQALTLQSHARSSSKRPRNVANPLMRRPYRDRFSLSLASHIPSTHDLYIAKQQFRA